VENVLSFNLVLCFVISSAEELRKLVDQAIYQVKDYQRLLI
jgi:hypothetical protein